MKYLLKYKFRWMGVYFSPFKFIIPQLYVGKIAIGTPLFYPRRWVKSEKIGYKKPIRKLIGFDFVGLGYKTKWSDEDYRFEWNPVWSFVFFKWQIALIFKPIEESYYWECWLYYSRHTKNIAKTTEGRLAISRKNFPCTWYTMRDGEKISTCYWDKILKKKYLKPK
jgi:hypothetical protein